MIHYVKQIWCRVNAKLFAVYFLLFVGFSLSTLIVNVKYLVVKTYNKDDRRIEPFSFLTKNVFDMKFHEAIITQTDGKK